MTNNKKMLEKAIESAESKLRELEQTQAQLEKQIEQTKNEIDSLEKTIASFRELDIQLDTASR